MMCSFHPHCHNGWQVNDLLKCKFCHSTVINAPPKLKATCIFMMSHKHCPYVTATGKCTSSCHSSPTLWSPDGTEHQMKRCQRECQPLSNSTWWFPSRHETEKHPLICPWGIIPKQSGVRSVPISSCFDLEASDGIQRACRGSGACCCEVSVILTCQRWGTFINSAD